VVEMKNVVITGFLFFLIFAGSVFAEEKSNYATGVVTLTILPSFEKTNAAEYTKQIEHLAMGSENQAASQYQEPRGEVTGTFILQPSALWVMSAIVGFIIFLNWYLNRRKPNIELKDLKY
jgi:hypothetical protein